MYLGTSIYLSIYLSISLPPAMKEQLTNNSQKGKEYMYFYNIYTLSPL